MDRYRIGVLGATGLVGQRLLERLVHHPWFEPVGLGASERSAGRPYGAVARWRAASAPPGEIVEQTVRECRADHFVDCDAVFSALDREVAQQVEPEFAARGFAVVSNASAFRMADDVPLVVPEINPGQLEWIAAQRRRYGGGYIVTNPNCSTTGLVMALAPLHQAFGVRRLVVATLQALSGAGIDGPSGLETVDNVLPWISGEEEKIEQEVGKILGADPPVSAHCHRVPVLDGHLEAVSVEFEREATPQEVTDVLREWPGEVAGLGLPSSPERPIVVREERDRPQPRLDREAGGGMSVVVGRVRRCPVLSIRFLVLSHNAVRGAAGGTLLNAELLAARGLLPRRSAS